MFGEICYVTIKPLDKDQIVITATKKGYFINKGYWSDEKGVEHLNYDKVDGVLYPTISDLMRSYSPHFSATINRQEYLYHAEEKGTFLLKAHFY